MVSEYPLYTEEDISKTTDVSTGTVVLEYVFETSASTDYETVISPDIAWIHNEAIEDDIEKEKEEINKWKRKMQSIDKKHLHNKQIPLNWQGWRSRR